MTKYLVVWDDEQGVCSPMALDPDCDGGLCGGEEPVAIFATKADARSAIRISTKFAELCELQGRPANTDFLLPAKSNLRIIAAKCYTPQPTD